MKTLLLCLRIFSLLLLSALQVLAIDTAGSMLKVTQFNHPGLTTITWTAWIYEYDIAAAGGNPFRLRIEFNSVGFRGTAGACSVGAMIQNVGHSFLDDASTGITPSFPALGLYFSNLDVDLPDNKRGVKLLANPTLYPLFGRVFENVDGGGFSGKNIYTRQDLGTPTFAWPIIVRWTVSREGSVTNPAENLSKDINGNWVPLIGTFMKWRFKVDINGTAYDVADYYLPIERAEYLSAFDPLTLHQEHFGSATQILGAQKGTVRFTDLRASDGINWYGLNDWRIIWRIDDEAGNLDSRFGWKTDGVSLTSRVGHQEDIAECFRNPGAVFSLASKIFPSASYLAGTGGSGSLNVSPGAGQSWMAVSNNAWISITSASSGTGSGVVNYSVASNVCPVPRSGTISVAGQIFTIYQAGNPNTISISPTNQAINGEGSYHTIGVTTAGACAWNATTATTWITILSGANGTGNGTISYVALPNFSNAPRSGSINVAGQVLTLNQEAAGSGQPGDVLLPRDFSNQALWQLENYGGAASTSLLNSVGTQSQTVGSAVFTGPIYLPSSGFGFVLHDQTRNLILEHAMVGDGTRATSIGFRVPQTGAYTVIGAFARATNIAFFGDGVKTDVIKNHETATPLFTSYIASNHQVNADDPFAGTGVAYFRFIVRLNQGDVLRFMSSCGPQNDGTADLTALRLIIKPGAYFLDVPPTHPFFAEIGKLAARGVTLGCGNNSYCPEANVTREQMAAFIIRALGNPNPPTPQSQRFADVPPGNPFYAFIEQLAQRQITLGCGGGNYCPASSVTREQMAAFLIRALGEFNPPTPGTQRFNDVLSSNQFYNFIDRLAVLGITLGCQSNPPLFCPTSPVTRGQMAAFLARAFNL